MIRAISTRVTLANYYWKSPCNRYWQSLYIMCSNRERNETMAIWMSADPSYSDIGDLGFVAEVLNFNTRQDWHEFGTSPCRKNLSHEPVLSGWCGSTNNINRVAIGVGIITRITKSGERMLVKILKGADLTSALDALGWPDLT